MSNINDTSVINEQYKDEKNLSIRITLHQKYSTNQYGYTNWIFDNYMFYEGDKVLELGCGNGSMWENRIQDLPAQSNLILSDLSGGMVELVAEKFRDYPNITSEIIDIQDIPYPDEAFDAVIANSMLYHIPDLQKAVSEVYRVLKPGGRFYATTLGNHGMNEYLHEKLKEFNPKLDAFGNCFPFNLENGKDILSSKFDDISITEYTDSLEITETSDLMNWILSTTLMSHLDAKDLVGLDQFFEKCKDSRGVIKIPKQSGMFIAIK